jgi:hypothetical protein
MGEAFNLCLARISRRGIAHSESRAGLIRRIVSALAKITRNALRLSFEIVCETTEFIRDVRCPQSKIAQKSSRLVKKRW